MDHLDRVREEFTRQADTFTVHAVKADKKMEVRFRDAIGDAGNGSILDVACGPGVVTAALAQRAAKITAFDARTMTSVSHFIVCICIPCSVKSINFE